MQTQCLYTAVKLGVADALAAAGGAAPAADLSEAVGATPDQLERVLRFLVTMGIFDEPSRGGALGGGGGWCRCVPYNQCQQRARPQVQTAHGSVLHTCEGPCRWPPAAATPVQACLPTTPPRSCCAVGSRTR